MAINSDSRPAHYAALTGMLLIFLLGYSFVTHCTPDPPEPDFTIKEGAGLTSEVPCPFGELCGKLPGFDETVEVKSGTVIAGDGVDCVTLEIISEEGEKVELFDKGGTNATFMGSTLMVCRPGPAPLDTVVRLVSDKIEIGTGQNRLIYIVVNFK